MGVQIPDVSTLNTTWNILIVDDDEDDYLIAKAMLKEAKGQKYTVHWASTYEKGREALKSNRYHAVLVDYDLGARSGIEFIREANEQEYPAPLILFTGRGNYEVDVEAMQAGATLYLTKGEANPLLLERVIRYGNELKQKEQALRDSEAALRISEAKERAKVAEMDAILDAVPAVVWVTHDTEAREATGNRAAYEFQDIPFGKNISMSAPNEAPQNVRVFNNGKELAPEEMPLQRSAATGEPIRNFEEKVVYEDGKVFYLLGNVAPLLDENGNPCGAIAAFIDITERKQVEEALRISEERFFMAFNANPNAQIISRQADGRIEIINDSFEQLFGYPREEVLGKTSLELNMFAHSADRQEAVRRLQADHFLRDFEIDIQTKAGEIRQASLSVERITIGGVPMMLTIFQDITPLRQAEKAFRKSNEDLRASEGRMRDFLESTHDSFFILDHDWRIQYVNRRFAEIIGTGVEEFIGKVFWEVFPRYLGTPIEQYYRTVMAERVPVHFESGGRYTPSWYEVSVYPTQDGISVFAVDRTEEHRAALALREREEKYRKYAEALRESEKGFRHMADAMPQLVWTARPDGTIDYLNQRYLDYDGVTYVEGEYWDWTNAVHPEDLQPLIDRMNQAVLTGEVQQTEFRIRMADGSYRWVLSRGIPIKDGEGNVIKWFGTNTDIEDQKQIEEKLRRSNQELEQFAFVASHDLQEPLRKIMMFGNAIQQEIKENLDGETQDNFTRMVNASERMQAIIQDLLELSRVNTQGRPFVQVSLSEVVAEVVSDLEPRIRCTGGCVQIDDLPNIEADPIQIHQVFQNLISNGLKFHKPDTPPIVKVSSTVIKKPTGKGQMVSIQVADNGIGFDEQQFSNILLPFKRLHGRSEFEGTGIGLAIVKKIIDRHHGEICAHSTPDVGSTVIVTLPVKQTG